MQDWSQLRYIGGGMDECQAFTDGTTVYRSIPLESKAKEWRHTPEFLESEQYQALVAQKLILPATKTDIDPATFPSTYHNDDKTNRVIYSSPFIPFGMFPSNYKSNTVWTKAHFIQYVRTIAEINKTLEDYLCCEPSMGNFLFHGSRPILVDLGAIGLRNEHNIAILKAGITRLLSGSGINLQGFAFTKPEVWQHIIEHCDNLNITEPANQWDAYNDRPLPKPGEMVADKEIQWLREMTTKYGVRTILDIGGNDGYFAFAVEDNFTRVCSIDRARNAITKGFMHAKKHNSSVVFYVVDITNPPKTHTRQLTKERMEWYNLLEADCVVVSSVMHHLCHQGYDLKWQMEQYGRLARKYLLLEYIDKKDPHVQPWPQTWSREQFFNILQEDWLLIGSLEGYARSEPSRPHRKWYALERKQHKPFEIGVEGFRAWHSDRSKKESAN